MLSFSETVLLCLLGKMLPPKLYVALETIVQEEYLLFRNHQGFEEMAEMLSDKSLALFDSKFVESSNLTCVDCGLKYQKETKQTYGLLTVSTKYILLFACKVSHFNQTLSFFLCATF